MAVSNNTYGSVLAIERMVGDIVLDRDFTTTSVPTTAQVEQILDDVAADMNRSLLASNYAAPISTGDSINRSWAVSINNYGAAALVLATIPQHAMTPGQEALGAARIQMYQALYDRGITSIEDNKLDAGRNRRSRLGAIYSGSQEDTDGNTKKPSFTRTMTDFPGVAGGITRTEN